MLADNVQLGKPFQLRRLDIVTGDRSAGCDDDLGAREPIGVRELLPIVHDDDALATKTAGHSPFVEGFVVASTVFCVGPLTILGSIQDGLTGDYLLSLQHYGVHSVRSEVAALTKVIAKERKQRETLMDRRGELRLELGEGGPRVDGVGHEDGDLLAGEVDAELGQQIGKGDRADQAVDEAAAEALRIGVDLERIRQARQPRFVAEILDD